MDFGPENTNVERFTLEKARLALVFVKPIMQELTEIWKELHAMSEQNDKFVEKKLKRIKYCLDELNLVGCIVRDLDTGHVDFQSEDDEHLFYSFYLGEKGISH